MANKDLLSKINAGGEVDTSILLDTLMYANEGTRNVLTDDYNGRDVKYIVKHLLKSDNLSEEAKRNVQCVQNYIDNHPDSEICSLVMHSSSDQFQSSSSVDGAKAAAFYSKDANGNISNVYVAFRGTGDGRWWDNGDAFSKEYSAYQIDGLSYFDRVMQDLKVNENAHVNVTGHSKGGNLAQFVTLTSEYSYLIDNCYSIDGQGFSPEAIKYFKKLYGEEFYEKQRQKMYSISGDNDYVNVLGKKVVPEENTVYIETPKSDTDFINSHGLVDENGNGNLFNYNDKDNAGFYNPTTKQRELAIIAKNLSDNIMQLPQEIREDVTRSVMSILEKKFTGGVGLNGEKATIEEYFGLVVYADDVFREIIYTWDGQKFVNRVIHDYLKEKVFNIKSGEEAPVIVDIMFNISAFAIQVGIEPLLVAITDFVKIISAVAELPHAALAIIEFCTNVVNSFARFCKENFDKNYKAAKEYLGSNSTLFFDTGALHSLAERLWAVNGRLQTLDSRLDGLYRTAKWTDLGKIIKVQSADMKIGWSNRVNNCANCLNDIANRFEKAESDILSLLGE